MAATTEDRQTERMKRLTALKEAVKLYVGDEKKRIEDEVEVLTAVKNALGGGAPTAAATKAAEASLAAYLRGF